MCKRNDQKAETYDTFSARTLGRHMALPGIIGGVIGAFFSWKWMLLSAAVFALLSGIWYCEQFDD